MDDEGEGSGLSGWAGFALGRMSAEHDRSMSQTAHWFNRTFFGRPSQASPRIAVPSYDSIAAENVELRRQLENYKHNYGRLKRWADEAEQKLKRLGALED